MRVWSTCLMDLWMDSTRLFPCGLCEVVVPEVMPDCWRRYWKLLLMNSGPFDTIPTKMDENWLRNGLVN